MEVRHEMRGKKDEAPNETGRLDEVRHQMREAIQVGHLQQLSTWRWWSQRIP